MTWNYRVVVKDDQYNIHEVYYDDKGKPEFFTEDPLGPSGESLEELENDLEYFSEALSLPVLNYNELEKTCTERCRKKNGSKESS